jgi:hypothetical protein
MVPVLVLVLVVARAALVSATYDRQPVWQQQHCDDAVAAGVVRVDLLVTDSVPPTHPPTFRLLLTSLAVDCGLCWLWQLPDCIELPHLPAARRRAQGPTRL